MQEKTTADNSQPKPTPESTVSSGEKDTSVSNKKPLNLENLRNHFFFSSFLGFLILIGIIVGVLALLGNKLPGFVPILQIPSSSEGDKLVPFASQEEFEDYLKESEGM